MLKLEDSKRLRLTRDILKILAAIILLASSVHTHGILGASFYFLMLTGGGVMVPVANRLENKFKPALRNFAGVVAITLTVVPGAFVGGYLGIMLIRACA